MKNKILIKVKMFSMVLFLFYCNIFSQRVLQNSVFANGGGLIASPNGSSKVVVGQPLSGLSTNINTVLHSGFLFSAGLLTDISDDQLGIPTEYGLSQNYPNPFNPSTTIKYSVPEPAKVRIEIFNTLGQSIATLVNEELSAGYYRTEYNASRLASGVYIYRMISNDYVETKKLMLLK
jgi:hypothetical protein